VIAWLFVSSGKLAHLLHDTIRRWVNCWQSTSTSTCYGSFTVSQASIAAAFVCPCRAVSCRHSACRPTLCVHLRCTSHL